MTKREQMIDYLLKQKYSIGDFDGMQTDVNILNDLLSNRIPKDGCPINCIESDDDSGMLCENTEYNDESLCLQCWKNTLDDED